MRWERAVATKVCKMCEKEKSVDDFHFTNKAKGYRQSYCKLCNSEYTRRWRKGNREKVSRQNANSNTRARLRLRAEMLEAYGGQCACCGETEEHFLTLDHIHGVPDHHRWPSGKRVTGLTLLRKTKKEGWPDAYRILCWNCNCSIGIHGFCPHQPHHANQRRY